MEFENTYVEIEICPIAGFDVAIAWRDDEPYIRSDSAMEMLELRSGDERLLAEHELSYVSGFEAETEDGQQEIFFSLVQFLESLLLLADHGNVIAENIVECLEKQNPEDHGFSITGE